MNPEDFWAPYEKEITSFDDLYNVIEAVFKKWSSKNKLFAWRGNVDARWPLHSSLYRRLYWTRGALPDERELYKKEGDILKDVHRWGLHVSTNVGRLSVLNQLAALQHYGAPTRMIDVTFNPWIAAWFAVEKKWDNGGEVYEDVDARLFAIDVTNRLINENDEFRKWEDNFKRPWPKPAAQNANDEEKKIYRTWCTKVFAWKPPRFDSRIAAQNGGFIFGGVPMSQGPEGPNQWPKDGAGYWRIHEVRQATSLSIRPHKLNASRGGVTQDAVYTFRIKSEAKESIRMQLEKNFGYKHSTIYPDFTGFSLFGTPELKTRP
ncbi:FRG domain-containing protein [Geothermobacter ehrlichii]|uniref:FRG domain-containing protein n=1 Tax=Geothermobacter ehrlichii TaxID=213224 RepID=A0A5D3WLY3_9BACT|nr:FRG domain-containing protein [Geothermobacter ehrlichii]TYO99742.1 FRG domain-containing protein [Geothermobacter ehrlichii]